MSLLATRRTTFVAIGSVLGLVSCQSEPTQLVVAANSDLGGNTDVLRSNLRVEKLT